MKFSPRLLLAIVLYLALVFVGLVTVNDFLWGFGFEDFSLEALPLVFALAATAIFACWVSDLASKNFPNLAIPGAFFLSYLFQYVFYSTVSKGVLLPFSGEISESLVFSFPTTIFAIYFYFYQFKSSIIGNVRGQKFERSPRTIMDVLFPQILKSIPKNRAVQILDLRDRASQLLVISNIILLGIVLLLVFAALFIIFAGEITRLGANIRDPITMAEELNIRLGNNIITSRRRTIEIQGEITEIDEKIKTSILELASTEKNQEKRNIESGVIDLRKRLAELNEEYFNLEEDFGRLETDYRSSNKELTDMRRALFEFQSGDKPQPVDENLLVATAVTRFGVLVIAIYLVQILINLYRYNTRVAAYYRAAADALVLLDHSPKKIEELRTLLWPDLDYGRSPQTIHQRIVEVFSKTADSALTRWSRHKKGKEETSKEDIETQKQEKGS